MPARRLDAAAPACHLSRMHVAIRAVTARPRMIAAAALGVAVALLLPRDWRPITRALVGWDVAVIAYIVLAWWMMAGADARRMRERAARQDVGALAALTLTTVAAIASIAAVAAELSAFRSMPRDLQGLHAAFAGGTLVASWFLVHTVFALHYAFEFYLDSPKSAPAFDFPGKTKEPGFSDFLYIAYTIGTSAAISDVGATTTRVRRVIVAHSIVSFFFNTAVLGFAVNVGAGLLGS